MFELGCGTGRLAENLLARHLPADARYLGADISDTMVTLSQARLRRFGGRAHVLRADGTVPLPVASGGFDRFLAVYVFDLLGPGDAGAVIAQARRLLRPGGLLCAVSLAPGQAPAARLVSQTWTGIWSRAPGLVGGCRPIRLEPLLDGWHITHRALVTAWALTSEVIVAAAPGQPPPRRKRLIPGAPAGSGHRRPRGDSGQFPVTVAQFQATGSWAPPTAATGRHSHAERPVRQRPRRLRWKPDCRPYRLRARLHYYSGPQSQQVIALAATGQLAWPPLGRSRLPSIPQGTAHFLR